MKRYGRFMVVAVACVVLLMVFAGVARAGLDCPPTETGVPPTEQPPATDTPIPPTAWEPTPSSPPEETRPPTGTEGSPPVVAEPTPTPTDLPPGSETPAPDPTATETPGAGNPPKEKHPTPTVIETLPVTGGGPGGVLGLTAVGMVALLGVAFLARMVRRAAG